MRSLLLYPSLFVLITCSLFARPVAPKEPFQDYIYQYSVIDALLAGVYDGELEIGTLKQHGDFGIGTFNRLDGELLLLDGKVYKLRYNGEVVEVPDAEKTPLACAKFFKPDRTIVMAGEGITYEDVVKRLEGELNGNSLYAVKIRAHFKTVKARSVHPAKKPYPPLAAYLADGGQYVFDFADTAGVCAGFLLPPYVARTNVPGMHLHYMSDDRTHGGHVFGFTADRVEIEIDEAEGLVIQRNTDSDMGGADLHRDRKKELHQVEMN